MPKLKVLSGKDIVKIFSLFDFVMVSQRGSHMKLFRVQNGLRQIMTIPNHNELDQGTLHAIYKQGLRYIQESDLVSHFYHV